MLPYPRLSTHPRLFIPRGYVGEWENGIQVLDTEFDILRMFVYHRDMRNLQ
jgi:hypothetical protein